MVYVQGGKKTKLLLPIYLFVSIFILSATSAKTGAFMIGYYYHYSGDILHIYNVNAIRHLSLN